MLWIRFWDHFQKKWWIVRLLQKRPFLGSNNTVRLGGYFALGWFLEKYFLEYEFTKDKIGEENIKRLEQIKQDIKDGKIVVKPSI